MLGELANERRVGILWFNDTNVRLDTSVNIEASCVIPLHGEVSYGDRYVWTIIVTINEARSRKQPIVVLCMNTQHTAPDTLPRLVSRGSRARSCAVRTRIRSY